MSYHLHQSEYGFSFTNLSLFMSILGVQYCLTGGVVFREKIQYCEIIVTRSDTFDSFITVTKSVNYGCKDYK